MTSGPYIKGEAMRLPDLVALRNQLGTKAAGLYKGGTDPRGDGAAVAC